jgi:hypothetical protein
MALQHNPKIVTNGLVLCLDAGNPLSYSGSGTVWNDLSGNGNNGTLTNGPVFSSDNKGSIIFDGTNDNAQIDSSSILNTSVWLSFWFKLNSQLSSSTTAYYTLVNIAGETTSPYRNQIYAGFNIAGIGGSNGLKRVDIVSYEFGNATTDLTGCYTTTDFRTLINTWFYISGGWTGTSWKVYVNGKDETNTTQPQRAPVSVLAPSLIGGSSSRYSPVSISSVNLYNRALSATEILQNYNATKGRYAL